MSQLSTASAPVRTAKALQKAKAIKQVKTAIRWHERARKQRLSLREERREDVAERRQVAVLQTRERTLRKEALENAKEDFLLGPLRPNRAVGKQRDTYGALTPEDMSREAIPAGLLQRRNDERQSKGLPLEYPLIVDGQRFFPIAMEDRVVVIKDGGSKGKIGAVTFFDEERQEVIVDGVKTLDNDNALLPDQPGHEGPVSQLDHKFSLQDIRLVIPYRITTRSANGTPKYVYQDVIVDEILLERHTTGIDPFTGIDYGTNEFPKEHRFDPETGRPLFNRYIAGTRHRIQWPWEKDAEETVAQPVQRTEEQRGILTTIRHPVQSLQRLFKKRSDAAAEQASITPSDEIETAQIDNAVERAVTEAQLPRGPANMKSEHDDDTARYKAEPSDSTRSFYPTLVYPPFPNDLSTELAPHIRQKRWADAKEEGAPSVLREIRERQKSEQETAKMQRKKELMESMKTPLQLRWEYERAKKLEAEQAKPKIEKDALLAALGAHMQQSRVAKKEQARKFAELG